VETVRAVGDGGDGDVNNSYISPHYECYISDSVPSGRFHNVVSSQNYGGWRTVTHETGIWLTPQAQINLPLTVYLVSNYRVYYDETIVGQNEIKSAEESKSSEHSTFYFDILPSSLDDFLSWSALTSNDSDGDNLKDSVEAWASVNNQYRIENKDSGLSLATAAASGSSQAELSIYTGQPNQKCH